MCGLCYKSGPNWPVGEYGILSQEKCPSGWYEFNHCVDTENDNNRDDLKSFTLHPSYKCDKTSLTFRYCFKGPSIPTVPGGFGGTGDSGRLFVVQNIHGGCTEFGANGGTIYLDNENTLNKNTYGNKFEVEGLNRQAFAEYKPYGFIYNSSHTQLSFCEIGIGSMRSQNNNFKESRFMEVGEFNYQKFGFFSAPNIECPVLNSPYGRLVGNQQYFHTDDENYMNQNRVLSGDPPVMVGYDTDWSVCEYDPHNAVN